MLRPRFQHIVLFIFSKYLIFAIILGGMDNRFKSLVTDVSHSAADWIAAMFHYFMYVLLVTTVFVLIFSLPYWLIFQIRNKILFIPAALAVLWLDAYCYVALNATGNWRYGVIHFSVGILTLILFFFKAIREKPLFYPKRFL